MYANRIALQTAVIDEAVRPDLAGRCGEFIRRAEQRIFLGLTPLRSREMEVRAPVTFTAGSGVTPADFLQARRLTWQAARPYALTYRHPEDFYNQKNAYPVPSIFTIDGSVIDIQSPATGTAMLSYYAIPATLSGDLTTNAVLLAHGHIYLSATLIELYALLDNQAKQAEWAAKFIEAVEGANLAAIKARYSGTALAPRIPGAA